MNITWMMWEVGKVFSVLLLFVIVFCSTFCVCCKLAEWLDD